MAILYLL